MALGISSKITAKTLLKISKLKTMFWIIYEIGKILYLWKSINKRTMKILENYFPACGLRKNSFWSIQFNSLNIKCVSVFGLGLCKHFFFSGFLLPRYKLFLAFLDFRLPKHFFFVSCYLDINIVGFFFFFRLMLPRHFSVSGWFEINRFSA